VAHLDGLDVEGGADDELSAFEDAHACGFRVEDGAGADEDVGAVLGEAAHDLHGSGDGHGDFEDGDTASGDGFGEAKGLLDGVGAEDGDQADFAALLKDCRFIHVNLFSLDPFCNVAWVGTKPISPALKPMLREV
jgi:hypothetical protein